MPAENGVGGFQPEEGNGISRAGPAPGGGLCFDRELHSRICAGCGCLCDDISFYLRGGRIVRTLNLCEVGWKRLSRAGSEVSTPETSAGRMGERLREAAEVLRFHPPVLVLGAENLDESSIRLSLELARALQGIWLPRAFEGIGRFYDRAGRFGWPTALLDEVRDQADLVIFWRADPLESHHRHLSRYSLFARGRFTERGNQDRNLTAVAAEKNTLEALCQQFFEIPPEQDASLLEALAQPGSGTGFPHREFPMLVRAVERACFVAVFVDPQAVLDGALEALFLWAARVNARGRKRLVLLPLWKEGCNVECFCQVSLDENGAAWGADFRPGSQAEGRPGVRWNSLAEMAGSVLLVHPGAIRTAQPEPQGMLAVKPAVILDPLREASPDSPHIVIPVGLPGAETEGVFFRSDGLPLRAAALEGLAPCPHPSAEQVLSGILAEVG